jgi:hypothetical protein
VDDERSGPGDTRRPRGSGPPTESHRKREDVMAVVGRWPVMWRVEVPDIGTLTCYGAPACIVHVMDYIHGEGWDVYVPPTRSRVWTRRSRRSKAAKWEPREDAGEASDDAARRDAAVCPTTCRSNLLSMPSWSNARAPAGAGSSGTRRLPPQGTLGLCATCFASARRPRRRCAGVSISTRRGHRPGDLEDACDTVVRLGDLLELSHKARSAQAFAAQNPVRDRCRRTQSCLRACTGEFLRRVTLRSQDDTGRIPRHEHDARASPRGPGSDHGHNSCATTSPATAIA